MIERYEDCVAEMTNEELVQELKNILPEKIPYGEMVGAPYPYSTMGEQVYPEQECYFIEEAVNRLERNIPKAAKVYATRKYCPDCGKQQKSGKYGIWYCERCGQALKHEE